MDNSDIGIGLLIPVGIVLAIICWKLCSCGNEAEEEQPFPVNEADAIDPELGDTTPKPPRRKVRKWIFRKRFKARNHLARYQPQPNGSQLVPEYPVTSRIFVIEDFTDFSRNRPTSSIRPLQREVLSDVDSSQVSVHGHHFPFKTLVIAADATPTHIGGYLINHFTKRMEYYSAPTTDMPWVLQNRSQSGNPTEFEMKNLLCALLLWEHVVVRYKKVAIFTDNSAIIGNSWYGSRVRDFIQHLTSCRNVQHVAPELIYVNSKETPDLFKEFILPADQLSRLNEAGFQSSIKAYHTEFQEKVLYRLKFNSIRRKILFWVRNPCPNCGFHVPRTGSLKRSHY